VVASPAAATTEWWGGPADPFTNLGRVTRIERALSAWEVQWLRLPGAGQASVAAQVTLAPLATLARPPANGLEVRSIAELRQEFEVLHVREDAIVSDKGDPRPDRRGSHPAIRLVFPLAQAMPGPDTRGAKRGVCIDKVRARPDDLRPGYLILQPTQLPGTPTSQPGAISQLRHGDEGDDSWSPGKERAIARGQ